MKLGPIEKDKQPSVELLRLFEKTRVAYLSANEDPDEYGGRWRKAVDMIRESYEELDAAGKELKTFIDEVYGKKIPRYLMRYRLNINNLSIEQLKKLVLLLEDEITLKIDIASEKRNANENQKRSSY